MHINLCIHLFSRKYPTPVSVIAAKPLRILFEEGANTSYGPETRVGYFIENKT